MTERVNLVVYLVGRLYKADIINYCHFELDSESINVYLSMSFSVLLFARQKNRKGPKEKKNTPLFSSSSLRSAEIFYAGKPALFSLANSGLRPSNSARHILSSPMGEG